MRIFDFNGMELMLVTSEAGELLRPQICKYFYPGRFRRLLHLLQKNYTKIISSI
jgi:hypothetical protein